MSTNATIALKLRKEDIGHIKKYNLDKYPVKTKKTYESETLPNIGFINECLRGVKLVKQYIQIYHHWDGYPDTLGDWLQKHYDTYEKIRNLVLIGSCSTIIDGIMPHIGMNWPQNGKNWAKNRWEDCKPAQFDEIPDCWYNYQYLAIPDPDNPEKVIWYWRDGTAWHNLKTGKFEKI